jgi:hypothetical protein
MEHFTKHIMVTKCKPISLLVDNHQLQLYLRVCDVPKENGVVLLFFPPDSINKLKPLYRYVYGPFTKFVNKAPDAEQSRSLLPATSQHGHSWHRTPLGPMAIFSMSRFVAPIVFKITPLHGPHGKHRLLSLRMRVYRFVGWKWTSYCSVRLLGADRIEKTISPILLSRS